VPDINDRIFLLEFPADEFVRLGDGGDDLDAFHRLKNITGADGIFPDHPDNGEFFAMRHMRRKTKIFDLFRDRFDLGFGRRGFER
jgi:hypothetical protein